MFVGKYKDFPKIDMTPSGAKGAVKQVVVGPEQGWEDYVLRVITLDVDVLVAIIKSTKASVSSS